MLYPNSDNFNAAPQVPRIVRVQRTRNTARIYRSGADFAISVGQVAGQILAENNVVGFSSYGEQFAGMHANQTFTGVAIGRTRGARA